MLKKFVSSITVLLLLLIFCVNVDAAQDTGRFTVKAKAVDAINLKAGLREITLWGVRAIKDEESILHIEATDLLDNLIASGEISCKSIAEKFPYVIARCITEKDEDLGVELLSRGLVIVDRRQMDDSEVAKIYEAAQDKARTGKVGIWGYLSKQNDKEKIDNLIKEYLADRSLLSIVGGAFAIIFSIIFVSLLLVTRAINIQKDEIEKIHYKEHLLRSKEKTIIISLLKTELEENVSILEAFIKLYKEMMDNVKRCSDDQSSRDKIGKSIKRFPMLQKNTFTSYEDKISFLNMNVVNNLVKLYSSFPTEEKFDAISETSTKMYIESILKESISKAAAMLIDIEKAKHILDLEYVIAINSVNDYKIESIEG